jgi:hypothetical protein
MALISGTQTKYDIQGARESLSDRIYRISPEDVPFMSMVGRGEPATATLEEWQTDALAAADGDNAHLEGDDTAFTTPAATVRVGNITQISKKSAIVSETTEAVKKAGRDSSMAFEMAKKSVELKRDQETIFLRAQGGTAGSAGVARRLAGLNAFIKTNVDKASDGANPVYTSGVPGAARTDGTQRAFTETILKNAIQLAWAQGGNPRVLMVGPFNKRVVSGFSGIATRNFDMSNVSPRATAIIAAADVYVSDFGVLRAVPNRFQRDRDAFILDPDLMRVKYLRPHKSEPLAKTGDAIKRQIVCEYTLQVDQEAGLALCADLLTS